MTMTVSALANFATAKSSAGASTDGAAMGPLADFMALLSQLGITIDATATTEEMGAAIGKKIGLAQGDTAKLIADLNAKGKGKEKGEGEGEADPAAGLAALLAQLDDSKAADNSGAPPIDATNLLSLVSALVTRQNEAAASKATADSADSNVVALTPRAAPSLAALVARIGRKPSASTQEQGEASTPVGTAFARLATLLNVSSKPAPQQAGDEAASATPAVPDASATPDMPSLTELLARLNDANRDGKTSSASPTSTAASTPEKAAPDNSGPAPATPQLGLLAAKTVGTDRKADEVKSAIVSAVADSTAVTQLTAPQSVAQTGDSSAIDASATPDQNKRSEMLVRHHLDLARDSQWLDTLARDISRAAQNEHQLRFQLNPEHLGSLKVELVNGAQGTSVKLTADTEAARAILVDAQPRLLAEARAQGLRISEAQVDLGGQGNAQRQAAEPVVIVRGGERQRVAEVEQETPAAAGERYA